MTQLSLKDALNKTLHHLMETDASVIVIGEDIVGGAGTNLQKSPDTKSGINAGINADKELSVELGGVFGVTAGLATRFGKARVIDTPISETAFVGMGIGAAATGLKPIVEVMFCDFMGVCFDQIINQAAKMRFLSGNQITLPLVIRTTMGAGDSSGAMHSQSLHGLLASMPGLKVVCPSNAADAAGLLKSALMDPNPVIMLEHKGLYTHQSAVEENLPAVPLGTGKTIKNGNAVTLVAVSAMVHKALEAANQLTAEGIEVEIIDPRTISPLDIGLILKSVTKTGRLLVVDEGAAFAGFADAVISLVSREGFSALKQAPRKLTPKHTPVPYAPNLEQIWLPGTANILETVKDMMND